MRKLRYVPLANDDWFFDEPRRFDVLVEDRGPIKTGLLDVNGVPLYRMPEAIEFGFKGKQSA